ncbi:hypothetical protein VRRI112168_10610 [Vreelandella rituensis]|uniref:Oxidoreductase molybdopterin-binding domain-containing protein n=1 Tax=Vreelandella rituensis TaxID=2282306 RepID=A0A368U0V0_9GAMM|nr:hypothetical protein [Halomonas rituensis]RCV90749.1 hypothetical protein DU506_11040 [Halomonas rituensis]
MSIARLFFHFYRCGIGGLLIIAFGAMATLLVSAHAAEVTPSPLSPSTDHSLTLKMVIGHDNHWLSLADIESTPLYDVEMQHPEGLEGRFTGVWLDTFLEHQGIQPEDRVRLIARDDYSVFLSADERQKTRYLLVTRLNGMPLDREQLGPLLLVAPKDAEAVLAGTLPQARWIWAIQEVRHQ